MELQKERYFESLQTTYWNTTSRGKCPVLDDSEGITLQSLGGVFIATLIGLGLALLTLAVEVFLQRRKDKKNKIEGESQETSATGSAGSSVGGFFGEDGKTRSGMKFRIGNKEMPAIIGHQ